MNKLAVKLQDAELAAALTEAGFDNPRKIRDAQDKDLKAIPGLGAAAVGKIRERFPKTRVVHVQPVGVCAVEDG